MTKGVDFSQQVADIAAPVSANGERLVEAARLQAEGTVVGAKSDAAAATFLGTAALDATKGKLEADEKAQIEAVTSKLEPIVDQRITVNNKKLAGQFLDSYGSDDFMGGQTVSAFQAEANRFANAERTGAISREEAITRIGDIVKHYSSIAPGWASEFRKVGAELTGIDRADAYGVHQALTTASLREKVALKRAEENEALLKEAASAGGFTNINEMPQTYLDFYRSTKQLTMRTSALENQKKTADIQQGELDKANTQLASAYIATGVSGMATEFAKLYGAHLASDTPLKQEDAQRIGGALAGQIEVLESSLVERINNLTTGKNPMSREAADKVLSGLRPQLQAWKDAVKTADGFNLWSQTIKNAKGNVQMIADRTMLAAPHLAVLKELGVLPDLVKAYVALGDPKKFEAQFGKDAAKALEVAMKNPQGYATATMLVGKGQSTIDDEIKRDPIIGKCVYNDMVGCLGKFMTEQGGVLKNEQKGTFSNFVGQYTAGVNQSNPAELKKFQELMYNPQMMKLFDQLDENQRKNALAPIFAKIDTTVPKELEAAKAAVEAYNNNPAVQAGGHKATVFFDPVTEQVQLNVVGGTGTNLTGRDSAGNLKTDKGSMTLRGLQSPFSYVSSPRSNPEARAQLEAAERSLAWLNTSAYVVANTLPKVNNSVGNINVGDVLRDMKAGFDTGKMGPLLQGTVQRAVLGDVPRNAAPQLADDQIMKAIVAGERSDINAGLSSAGALGPMQLMPDTARELGLKVDETAGVDERTDISKAGPAAIKYVRQHLSEFGGDVAKAAAAYNAGPGNLRKAIDAAKKAGSPDEWVYFLPKPSETGPYIARFRQALQ